MLMYPIERIVLIDAIHRNCSQHTLTINLRHILRHLQLCEGERTIFSQFRMTEFGTLEIVTDPEPKDKEEESPCPQSENTPSNGAPEPPNHSNQAETATQRAKDAGQHTYVLCGQSHTMTILM